MRISANAGRVSVPILYQMLREASLGKRHIRKYFIDKAIGHGICLGKKVLDRRNRQCNIPKIAVCISVTRSVGVRRVKTEKN